MWSRKLLRCPPCGGATSTAAQQYRYIVIGAGSSGCVVAARLARAGFKTLLIEAGSDTENSFLNPIIHVPIGYLAANGHPKLDWCLTTEPDEGIAGRTLRYTRGKGLGGCSAVNGMIVNRGQKSDFEAWAQLSGDEETWGPDAVLAAFKKIERYNGSAVNRRGTSSQQQQQQQKQRSKNEVVDVSKEAHGYAGEMPCVAQRHRYPVLEQVQKAFVQAGLPVNEDINNVDLDQYGVGFYEVNQLHGGGVRATAAGQFLAPVLASEQHRKNLDIVCGSTVQRILFDTDPPGKTSAALNASLPRIRAQSPDASAMLQASFMHRKRPRAIGVQCSYGPRFMRWEARLDHVSGEVILCAGAIHSPALLQVSGIGPRRVLNELNITPVHTLEGVGESMYDHLQIRPVFRITKPARKHAVYGRWLPTLRPCVTLNTLSRSVAGVAAIGLDYALRRSGPLSMAPSQLGAFFESGITANGQQQQQEGDRNPESAVAAVAAASTDESAEGKAAPASNSGSADNSAKKQRRVPDLQAHVQPLSLPAFGQPLHRYDGITLSICNLKPTSTGTVRAKHVNLALGRDAVEIRTNYLSTDRDKEVAVRSIQRAREIAAQPALRDELGLEEVLPGAHITDPADILKAVATIATTIFHPTSTCKMGKIGGDPSERPVVDSKLRVFGVDGLRVADASIMPRITSGNTATPCMMIGEKAADLILRDSNHVFQRVAK